MKIQIDKIILGNNQNTIYLTIFQEILSSDLLSKEKTLARLQDKSVNLVGAGIYTVKWAVSITTFYVLSTPEILHHLRSELDKAQLDIETLPTLKELEQLTYLTAVIQEG